MKKSNIFSAPTKKDKSEQLTAMIALTLANQAHDNEDMEIGPKQGSSKDNTKHKDSYSGTPIRQGGVDEMRSGAGYDSEPACLLNNP